VKASVVMVVRNESKRIKYCLEALLQQSWQDFEIVIIDNRSTDGTDKIVHSFEDKRIKYYYESAECGLAGLRNLGLNIAIGDYVFFTDGDCVAEKHWLEEGLKNLARAGYVGVEGRTFYESQNEISVSDCNTRQMSPGHYMTCNVAYDRKILDKAGYFDPVYKYAHEDRDLAYRVMRYGKIGFSQEMLVFHQEKKLKIGALFNRAKRAENMVYFIKKHGKNGKIPIKILYPRHLLVIFFPPLLIFTNNYRTVSDLLFGLFKYFSFVYERLIIWKAACKNRVFIV
jgi:glycosyltransferase involved in cell wall biosynthesis